jgi:hypothetical protein
MPQYTVLRKNRCSVDEYMIVPLREIDMLDIGKWRNEQMDVLRQNVVLTGEDQWKYFASRVVPCFTAEQPELILFSYLEHDCCIGYGGLTNIDWKKKRGELSFLVQTKRAGDVQQYRNDLTHFLQLMKEVVFKDLRFTGMFTETYDVRPLHVSILEAQGFCLKNRLKQAVAIQENPVDSLIHECVNEYEHA